MFGLIQFYSASQSQPSQPEVMTFYKKGDIVIFPKSPILWVHGLWVKRMETSNPVGYLEEQSISSLAISTPVLLLTIFIVKVV